MLVALRRALPLPLCLVVLLSALLLPLLTPLRAHAGAISEDRFVVDTQQARANHNRRAYRVRAHLTDVAQHWAHWMARHRTVRHNPYLTSQIGNWSALGENVGRGATEHRIHRAFMNSTEHRANILSRTYRQVGIGTARGSDGRLYVSEVFRRPR